MMPEDTYLARPIMTVDQIEFEESDSSLSVLLYAGDEDNSYDEGGLAVFGFPPGSTYGPDDWYSLVAISGGTLITNGIRFCGLSFCELAIGLSAKAAQDMCLPELVVLWLDVDNATIAETSRWLKRIFDQDLFGKPRLVLFSTCEGVPSRAQLYPKDWRQYL